MSHPSPVDAARYLTLASEEARKGIGLTAPNPPVGAVIIDKDCRLIGKGFHRKAGGPHAEIEAIADAESSHGKGACAGGTIYVTLEPCSSHGRTPPCCDAIRNAGIKHVVWGVNDPNPDHAGAAIEILSSHGIHGKEADQDLPGAHACRQLIAPFSKWITTKLPWVIAKAGTSLDGRISRPHSESQWITSTAAREDAHHLRSEVDAIIVGANTARVDNPSLTIRGNAYRKEKAQPWRVVLTKGGKLPEDLKLFSDEHKDRTLIYRNSPLKDTLADLTAKGCMSVLVEGGAQILGQFFNEGLVDEACFYIAPRICGGGIPAVGNIEFTEISKSWQITNPDITILNEGNIRVRGLTVEASD